MNVISQSEFLAVKDIDDVSPDLLFAMATGSISIAGRLFDRTVVEGFLMSPDHGLEHSRRVWAKCQELIDGCPLLWRLITQPGHYQYAQRERLCRQILLWASVFHDMSRFAGAGHFEHEKLSADLAVSVLSGIVDPIFINQVIVSHDYINPFINGCLPPGSSLAPLAELFRLADKICDSPSEMVDRYVLANRAHGNKLFDKSLTDEDRLDFPGCKKKRDSVTWMLVIFALQPNDFMYAETRTCYRRWHDRKIQARTKIKEILAREEMLCGHRIPEGFFDQLLDKMLTIILEKR